MYWPRLQPCRGRGFGTSGNRGRLRNEVRETTGSQANHRIEWPLPFHLVWLFHRSILHQWFRCTFPQASSLRSRCSAATLRSARVDLIDAGGDLGHLQVLGSLKPNFRGNCCNLPTFGGDPRGCLVFSAVVFMGPRVTKGALLLHSAIGLDRHRNPVSRRLKSPAFAPSTQRWVRPAGNSDFILAPEVFSGGPAGGRG